MRKNVLISILAMTSASSMTAYANANLDKINTDDKAEWEGATSDVTLENGVIVSTDGTPIEQAIGSLLPGDYKVTATLDNAKILINGKALDADNQFHLDAATNVTVRIEAVTADKQYQVAGLALELVYNFSETNKLLVDRLVEVTNKIYDDETGATLLEESSQIAAKIAKLVDDQPGAYEAYKLYEEYELYKGVENSTITAEIDALETKVDAQRNNSSAYYGALQIINGKSDELKTAWSVVANITDAGTKEYTENLTEGLYNELSAYIKQYDDDAKAAFGKGEAGLICTEEKNKEFTAYVDKSLQELSTKISNAIADHPAYVNVTTKLTEVKTAYDAAVQEVYNALQVKGEHADVYADMRTKAQNELNAVYVNIKNVETAIGTKENHEGAAGKEAESLANLSKYAGDIATVKAKYIDLANNLNEQYNEAVNMVNALQGQLDEIKKLPDVADKNKEAIDKIQASIEDLSADIEADYAKNDISADKYAETAAEINTALTELSEAAGVDVENYVAYNTVKTTVGDMQTKFDEAKKAVNALVSKDGLYKVDGKYNAEETALQTEISKYLTDAEAAYKAGTCAKYYADNSAKMSATDKKVTDYQATADEALAAYETVIRETEAYNEAIDALEKTVTNRSVIAYDYSTESQTKTYGNLIDEFNKKTTEIVNAKNAALKLTGAAHSEALVKAAAMTNGLTIVSEAEALAESYAEDMKEYDKEVVTDAVIALLDRASDRVDEVQKTMDSFVITEEGLGNSYEEINEKRDALQTRIDEQTARINDTKTNLEQLDKAVAMATLSEIITELTNINNDIAKLSDEADKIAEKVTANNNAYKTAQSTINEIKTLINGNAGTGVKGIAALNEDDSRTQEFAGMVTELLEKVSAQEAAVNKAYDSETLADAWKDTTNEEGETVEGIESKLEAISKEVADARAKAVASTDNYKAYTTLSNYIVNEEMESNLLIASRAISNVTSGAGKTYYDGLVTSYTSQLNTIKDKIQDSYIKRTCVDSKDELSKQLELLNTNISKLADDATANQEAYDEQNTKYTSVNEKWAEVYYDISTNDQSSAAEGYLKELTDEQAKLNSAKSDIEKFFGQGQSSTKNDSILTVLSNIETAVNSIAKTQEDGYDTAVEADNKAYMEKITAAVNAARTSYSTALDKIDEFGRITNPHLVYSASGAITTANATINGMLTTLRDFTDKVNKAYEANPAGEIFDVEEAYLAEVNGYKATIDDAVTTLDETVSGVAAVLLANNITTAEGLLQNAKAELNAYEYDETVVESAFADVEKNINDAKKAESKDFLALEIDNYLNTLDNTANLIAADKEVAADKEYAIIIKAADEKAAEQLEDLNQYVYPNDQDGATKSYYINMYNDMVETTINQAKRIYAATAEGNLYATMADIKTLLDNFETSSVYEDATNAAYNEGENQAAYESFNKQVAEIQAELDEAAKFVDAYVITYDYVSALQNSLNTAKSDIEYYYKQGWLTEDNANIVSRLTWVESNIPSIYDNANRDEEIKIKESIEALKGDQNKAAEAVESDEALRAEVDAYVGKIDDLAQEFEDMLASDEFVKLEAKDRQPKYLEYEKKVAAMRTELTAYYDAALGNTTYQSLVASMTEVEAELTATSELLDACHANVKAEYNADVAAAKVSLDEVKAEAEKYNAEGSILFYNDKVAADIAKVASEIDLLKNRIANSQVRYTVNQEVYDKLTGEVNILTITLDAVVERISDYKFTNVEAYSSAIESIRSYIAASQSNLDVQYKNYLLNESSTVLYKAYIENMISLVEKDATYTNIWGKLDGYGYEEKSIYELLEEAANKLNAVDVKFTAEKKWELDNKLRILQNAKMYADDYNNNAYYDGFVEFDINGNQIVTEDGLIGKSIHYMREAVLELEAKIAELAESLNALSAEADDNAYILGDVDRNGEVLVDDYTEIINYALGNNVPEAGSMKFLAADVNEDGNINIGDVTKVTNIILGIDAYSARHAITQLAASQNGATADALTLTADDENGVKRVAVSLKATKAYVGAQLDVKLPAGVTLLNESLGEAATDHQLYSNTLGDGTHRIIISSMQNSEFAAGGETLVYLELSGRNADRVTVADVMVTDASGMLYSVGGNGNDGTTGIDGVNAEKSLKEKIYSVGGQMMNSIKKGINIIRNADGTTKKVIRK